MTIQSLIIQPPNDDNEKKEINELKNNVSKTDKIAIITPDGQQTQIPYTVFCILKQALEVLNNGDSLTLIPMDKELTTQQASDVLNVSRPYFIKLLENGELPFKTTGKHRKILMYDLMEYKEKRDNTRKDSLKELSKLSQELELYD